MKVSTKSLEETLTLGAQIGRHLQAGDIVLLFGALGAGKTALTQGICHGLGVKPGDYVRSPSFTLINEYQGTRPIYHVDLYRLDHFAAVESLGLEDYFFGSGTTIVEWAEKLYPKGVRGSSIGFGLSERIEIAIIISGENERIFDIVAVDRAPLPQPVFTLH